QRLLDQHRHAALNRGQDRIDVQVLVGGNDRAGHFRAAQQLAVALRHEVGADLRRHLSGPVRVLLGEPDPFHRRVPVGHLAAQEAYAAAADDRKADIFRRGPHTLSPPDLLPSKSAIAAKARLFSTRDVCASRRSPRYRDLTKSTDPAVPSSYSASSRSSSL